MKNLGELVEGSLVAIGNSPSAAIALCEVEENDSRIPAAALPRLTERFFRVDTGRSREMGGTGLGLAIVKHVLKQHQADLEVESTPGKGSLFRCHFPAERVLDCET